MHLLSLDEEFICHGLVVVLPESLGVVANIAEGKQVSVIFIQGHVDDIECMRKGTAYLIVMRPMPAKMPIMMKSCQKSRVRSRVKPRMSKR